MVRLKAILPICIICFIIILSACTERQLMLAHPSAEESGMGKRPPICVDCHDARNDQFDWAQFNHTPLFADNHRQLAQRNANVCAMCHQTSFCQNCHAGGTELKPSLLNPADSFRRTPHRGDYLTRHRIDGRVDPSSCFRCHGNPKTSTTCSRCHR